MKKIMQNLLGGLAGAAALTLTQQLLTRVERDAPRLDMIGEDAVAKTAEAVGVEVPSGESLTGLAVAGDLGMNSIYYRMIGNGDDKNLLLRGVGYGLLAGVGALSLPAPMGLDDTAVTRTTKTKVLTVGLYMLGGIITALALKAMRR